MSVLLLWNLQYVAGVRRRLEGSHALMADRPPLVTLTTWVGARWFCCAR